MIICPGCRAPLGNDFAARADVDAPKQAEAALGEHADQPVAQQLHPRRADAVLISRLCDRDTLPAVVPTSASAGPWPSERT